MNAFNMLKMISSSYDPISAITRLAPTEVLNVSGIFSKICFSIDGSRFAAGISSSPSNGMRIYSNSGSGFALEQEITEDASASISSIGLSADGSVLAYCNYYSGERTVKIWERVNSTWSQAASIPWVFTGDPATPNLQYRLTLFPDKTGFLMQTYDALEVTTYEVYFYKKQTSGWTFDSYSVSGPSNTKTNREIKPLTSTPDYAVQFGWASNSSNRYPVIYRKNASNLWEYTGIISSDEYGNINRGAEDYAWRNNKLLLLRENTSGFPVIGAYNPDTSALTEQYALPVFFRDFDFDSLQLVPALYSDRRSGILHYAGDARNLYVTGLDSINAIESRIEMKDDFPDMSTYGGAYLFDDKMILSLTDGTSNKIATYML